MIFVSRSLGADRPHEFMRTILAVTIAAVSLAGCGTPSVRTAPDVPVEETALALLAEGRLAAAADAYVALARSAEGAVAQRRMLKAVALFLDTGHSDRASELLDELAEQTLAGDLAARRDLLAAELAMRQGRPERTIELLSGTPAGRFGPGSPERFHRLLARAYEDTGRTLEAARERVALDVVLGEAAPRAANRDALWNLLRRTDRQRRERELISATGTFLGWLRLVALVEAGEPSPFGLERALIRWHANFPGHPAYAAIVTGLLDSARKTVPRPTRVALLLPFHGDFTEAAIAIRDGFLAAWYADAPNRMRPAVEVYDTSFEAVEVVYARAVEAGSDFVVGPLRRGQVTSIACGTAFLVTTLALNEADSAPPAGGEQAPRCGPERIVPRLYHFALAPETEARQVAERAWFAGFGKALALTREGTWGERVFGAFAEEWERLGGVLLDHRTLPAESSDIGSSAAAALGVTQSRERARAVSGIIGRRVEHEPRRRQDIDVVFMAAFPASARQLMPQLAFHHGAGLPVYATSHAWSGLPDPAGDRDLDGVTFGDMPWLVAPTASDQALREQIRAAFGGEPPSLPRLHAFGADAYRLATNLHRMTRDRSSFVAGHTGSLSVTSDHRIARRLAWARFEGGLPAPDPLDLTDVEPASSL